MTLGKVILPQSRLLPNGRSGPHLGVPMTPNAEGSLQTYTPDPSSVLTICATLQVHLFLQLQTERIEDLRTFDNLFLLSVGPVC